MENVDYKSVFDEVLDIKSQVTYKRELGEVPYTNVGVEIEACDVVITSTS